MNNHLGRYIKARREQLGLRHSEVARRLGYDNVNKGSRRLHRIEEGRWINRDFLLRLVTVLQIEPQVVEELIQRDREEYVASWNQWADQPVPMQAVMRCIPGFMVGINMPDDVTTPEQAVAWAVETARQKNKKIIIVASRRISYTIHEDGRVDGPFHATPNNNGLPWMALGETPFLVNLDGSGGVESQQRSPS
jgi:transcriptional regulator with XRE-family HTH domain